MQFFPKGFIIMKGPRVDLATAVANLREGALFRIIAPYGNAARAVQQSEMTSMMLNTHQAFVLVHDKSGFIWKGDNSNEHEDNLAKMLVEEYEMPNVVEFEEGQEPDEFWGLLGGKGEYAKIKDLMNAGSNFEPMLFSISNISGYMTMKQIPAFNQ